MVMATRRLSPLVLWIGAASAFVALLSVMGPPLIRRVTHLYDAYTDLRADEAYRPVEHLHDLTGVAMQTARSPSLAVLKRGQFAAEELSRAKLLYALTWNAGNAVHYSHIVLGRLALHSGDLETAKCHILAAGKTRGSPQLNDYGPDMTLAEEMLGLGQSAVVLEYLAECDQFWHRKSKNRIKEWSDDIRNGRMPDFGMNSGLTSVGKR